MFLGYNKGNMNENVSLKSIVANNLTELRKEKGLTQIQLAELFNYSDKAVSKWERGDTLPDLETLKALADYYQVTLDYLVHEGSRKEKSQYLLKEDKEPVNTKAIAIISCMIAPLICVAVYISLLLSLQYNYWLAFLWWIPVDFLLLFIFAWLWWGKVQRTIYGILLSWTMVVCTYLELGVDLPNGIGWQVWEIILVGIPLTIALLLWMQVRIKPKEETIESNENMASE